MHVKTVHLSERYSPLIKRELGVISRRSAVSSGAKRRPDPPIGGEGSQLAESNLEKLI